MSAAVFFLLVVVVGLLLAMFFAVFLFRSCCLLSAVVRSVANCELSKIGSGDKYLEPSWFAGTRRRVLLGVIVVVGSFAAFVKYTKFARGTAVLSILVDKKVTAAACCLVVQTFTNSTALYALLLMTVQVFWVQQVYRCTGSNIHIRRILHQVSLYQLKVRQSNASYRASDVSRSKFLCLAYQPVNRLSVERAVSGRSIKSV